jgi:hypothetical protein
MKPQVIIYLCICSIILILVLLWGFAETKMTYLGSAPVFGPNPGSVRLGIWELNALRMTSFSSSTKLSIASEATRQELDLLTAFARSGLLAAPIVAIGLLSTSWRYLSRGQRFRVGFLLFATAFAIFLYLLIAGSNLTGPFIKETIVNEVRYNWPIIILMVINLGGGLGSSIYFILGRSRLGNGMPANNSIEQTPRAGENLKSN